MGRLSCLVGLAAVVLFLAACAAAPQPVPLPGPVPLLDSLQEAKMPRPLGGAGVGDYYPAAARRAQLQGRVLVEFGIGPSGRVIRARVTKEEPAGVFGKSAISIIDAYRFAANTPATQKYRLSIVYALVPCPHPKPCQVPKAYPTMNMPIIVTAGIGWPTRADLDAVLKQSMSP